MSALCPAPEDLSRALTEDADAGFLEHLKSCSRCSDEWDGALRLRALVRSLPAPVPTRGRVADVRARLVAEAVARRRGRRTFTAVAALTVFAAAAGVALAVGARGPVSRSSSQAPAGFRHGVVSAWPGARYSLGGAAPDEVVLLESGTIHVEVSPLRAGERFRVRVGDGEVEVRGTAFDVAVEEGHLNAVTVQHGRVEVRDEGGAEATLGAGQAWRAASPVPPAGTASAAGDQGAAARGAAPVPDAAESGAHPGRHHAVTPRRTTAAAPLVTTEGTASAPIEPPETVSRDSLPPPAQSAPVSPAVNAPPKGPPPASAPEAVPSQAAPPRARDDERRERREERRERYDQRRMR